ncbi:MAG: hypothetical protein AAF989_00375 [Planctomycetota bacterium]
MKHPTRKRGFVSPIVMIIVLTITSLATVPTQELTAAFRLQQAGIQEEEFSVGARNVCRHCRGTVSYTCVFTDGNTLDIVMITPSMAKLSSIASAPFVQ